MKSHTYAGAGVDVERGDRFVELVKSLGSPAVSRAIGGFSGAFEIDTERYRHPTVLTTTDGVGTKILLAHELRRFDTIGIDLVAMCINDLLVCGADPVSFLDYIACGRIDEGVLREVLLGIVAGCEQAGCTLTGGETAELPDMYGEKEFDLAGFAVGIAEREGLLPKSGEVREGDLIMGLPSAGVHSNGLSLARKVVPKSDRTLRAQLLEPTRIYATELKRLLPTGAVLAAAHITGGGLEGNISRIVPAGLAAKLHFDWKVPEIFSAIMRLGRVEEAEMRRVFNMGIGIALVVHSDEAPRLSEAGAEFGISEIGVVVRG